MSYSPKARRALTLIVAVAAMLISSAQAATPIEQNRDEPARNPYQQFASKACNGATTCTLAFPALPKTERLVIDYISCLITASSYDGAVATLYAKSKPAVFATFQQGALVVGSVAKYPLNFATQFYVNGGDAPAVAMTTSDTFVGSPYCLISGYTVTLP